MKSLLCLYAHHTFCVRHWHLGLLWVMRSLCPLPLQLITMNNPGYWRPTHCHLLPQEHSWSTLIRRKEHHFKSYQITSWGKNSLSLTVAPLTKPLQDKHWNGGFLERVYGLLRGRGKEGDPATRRIHWLSDEPRRTVCRFYRHRTQWSLIMILGSGTMGMSPISYS